MPVDGAELRIEATPGECRLIPTGLIELDRFSQRNRTHSSEPLEGERAQLCKDTCLL